MDSFSSIIPQVALAPPATYLKNAEETAKQYKSEAKALINTRIKDLQLLRTTQTDKGERRITDVCIKDLKKAKADLQKTKIDTADSLTRLAKLVDKRVVAGSHNMPDNFENSRKHLNFIAKTFTNELKSAEQSISQHVGNVKSAPVPLDKKLEKIKKRIEKLQIKPPPDAGLRTLKKNSIQLGKLERKWTAASQKVFRTPQGRLWKMNNDIAAFKEDLKANRAAVEETLRKSPEGMKFAARSDLLGSVGRLVQQNTDQKTVSNGIQDHIDRHKTDTDPEIKKIVTTLQKMKEHVDANGMRNAYSMLGGHLLDLAMDSPKSVIDKILSEENWPSRQPRSGASTKEINKWVADNQKILAETRHKFGIAEPAR